MDVHRLEALIGEAAQQGRQQFLDEVRENISIYVAARLPTALSKRSEQIADPPELRRSEHHATRDIPHLGTQVTAGAHVLIHGLRPAMDFSRAQMLAKQQEEREARGVRGRKRRETVGYCGGAKCRQVQWDDESQAMRAATPCQHRRDEWCIRHCVGAALYAHFNARARAWECRDHTTLTMRHPWQIAVEQRRSPGWLPIGPCGCLSEPYSRGSPYGARRGTQLATPEREALAMIDRSCRTNSSLHGLPGGTRLGASHATARQKVLLVKSREGRHVEEKPLEWDEGLHGGQCGPRGDGVAPAILTVVSTGRVGSKVFEAAIRRLGYRGQIRHTYCFAPPPTMQIDLSLDPSVRERLRRMEAFRGAIIHMMRDPLDVALSIRKTAIDQQSGVFMNNETAWMGAHLSNFRSMCKVLAPRTPSDRDELTGSSEGRGGRMGGVQRRFVKYDARRAKVHRKGANVILNDDVFDLIGHLTRWYNFTDPTAMAKLSVKHEALASPAVADAVGKFLCLDGPYKEPPADLYWPHGPDRPPIKRDPAMSDPWRQLAHLSCAQQRALNRTYRGVSYDRLAVSSSAGWYESLPALTWSIDGRAPSSPVHPVYTGASTLLPLWESNMAATHLPEQGQQQPPPALLSQQPQPSKQLMDDESGGLAARLVELRRQPLLAQRPQPSQQSGEESDVTAIRALELRRLPAIINRCRSRLDSWCAFNCGEGGEGATRLVARNLSDYTLWIERWRKLRWKCLPRYLPLTGVAPAVYHERRSKEFCGKLSAKEPNRFLTTEQRQLQGVLRECILEQLRKPKSPPQPREGTVWLPIQLSQAQLVEARSRGHGLTLVRPDGGGFVYSRS
jgi:hypothetical protein